MIRTTAARLLKTRAVRRLALAAIALEAAAVVAVYAVERASLRAVRNTVTYGPGARGPAWRKVEMAGVRRVDVVPAGAAGLADDDEVIGVEAGGAPRAYPLKALRYPPWHVVNDRLGGVPVSVTFCDVTGCTRVYTRPGGRAPLDLGQAGLWDGEMVLKDGPAYYLQRSGRPHEAPPLPYPDFPWTRTTWKSWKQQHPRTDVFVGELKEDAP